jgi:GNAT superfamily N-acetyltransferase
MHTRRIRRADLPAALAIVNRAAQAYRGVIPADRWRQPYMPARELRAEIAHGVRFSVAEENGRLLGLMGLQDRGDVTLIRHAYVAPAAQGKGIGTRLLRELQDRTRKPLLIGTWAEAAWAIAFYRRNGFRLTTKNEKDALLRRYWSIPERQVETSVVLVDRRWSA